MVPPLSPPSQAMAAASQTLAKRRAARRKRQECTAKRHLSADMRVAKMAAGIESKLRKQIAASRAEELRVAQSVLARMAEGEKIERIKVSVGKNGAFRYKVN